MATKQATKEDILDAIGAMSVLELSELLSEFEEKFGVSAAAPAVAAVAAPTGAAEAAPEVEEKTDFDVVITAVGDKKIQVIKEVRSLTALGLKEAKELVDNTPSKVMEGVATADAEKAKEALEATGATVELQ